jgi:predicted double-glycine peptidase
VDRFGKADRTSPVCFAANVFAPLTLVTSAAKCLSQSRTLHTSRRLASSAGRLLLVWILASVVPGVSLGAGSGEEPGFWLDVPFVRQAKNLCGAASVSMILQYWHKASPAGGSIEVPPFPDIAEALRSAESKGVFGSQMKAYLDSLGYQVYVFKGRWDDVESHISKGRPLIVGLGNRGSLDHYVVVTGWNGPENVVLVNDPAQRKLLKLDRKNFQKSWEQTACWTLLALPPSLPAAAPTSDGQ